MCEACIYNVFGSVFVSVSLLVEIPKALFEVPEAPGILEGAGVKWDCVLDHFWGICFAFVEYLYAKSGPLLETFLGPKRCQKHIPQKGRPKAPPREPESQKKSEHAGMLIIGMERACGKHNF